MFSGMLACSLARAQDARAAFAAFFSDAKRSQMPTLVISTLTVFDGCAPTPEPIQRALLVDLDHRGVVERLVPADVLDEPAVARAPLVRDDDPVEGTLLRPQTAST